MSRRTLLGVMTLFVVAATGLQGQTAVEKELTKIEHDWNTAWMKKDSAALQSLYATEFIGTGSDGVTYNKAQEIAMRWRRIAAHSPLSSRT